MGKIVITFLLYMNTFNFRLFPFSSLLDGHVELFILYYTLSRFNESESLVMREITPSRFYIKKRKNLKNVI